ncbi:MAG: hypothetical protein JNG83_00145, partial [Opitutaceae bacterium]|nr:hypothetical protein [Opitutaceae bacterium]
MPRFLLFAAACLLATAAAADVTCPPIFGDRMVLQRDRPVPVWGSADPAERITVKFGGQTHQAVAGPDGRWRVTLDPLAASGQPRLLSIRGKNTLLFADVLVGEVWLCSGQSNMEKPLGPRVRQMPTDNYEAELTQAECPPLRLFRMPKLGVAQPGDHTRTWLACSAESLMAADFSAAAYYFGRELVRELGVPVGLVQSTVGGTRIEAWMPLAAFEADPALRGLEKVRYPQSVEGLQATELYTAMIAPLAPYALRGFLWYQGEANCLNAENESYTAKMRGLIQSWRNAWNDGAAPFYFAQLAPYTYSALTNRPKQVTAEALPAL